MSEARDTSRTTFKSAVPKQAARDISKAVEFYPTFRIAPFIFVNIQRYNRSYAFPSSLSSDWCSSVRLTTRGDHCPGMSST
jgi:hypothetical protein